MWDHEKGESFDSPFSVIPLVEMLIALSNNALKNYKLLLFSTHATLTIQPLLVIIIIISRILAFEFRQVDL